MAETEPDLARLRPLFLLEKLPPQLRSDVLADGSIVSACGFSAEREAPLSDDVVVIRDDLFAAFRTASDVPLTRQMRAIKGRPVDTNVSINEDGSGTIEVGGKTIRFLWVTLLSSDVDKRLSQLDRFLKLYPLSRSDEASLRALVEDSRYSDSDFLTAATMLESSPEVFTERLGDKLRRQGEDIGLAPVDVLPDDDRYWRHLVPLIDGSATLADYVAKELHEAWSDALDKNPAHALHALAITFAAPELVPRGLVQEMNAEAVASNIESISKVEDPFSLLGAFEICVDRVEQDQRFVALGDALLDHLCGDMQRLMGACGLFGAIFIITTAHFATHETLQRQPVYWRRLAAASHASLVVRVCGGSIIDPDQMISWATRLFGDAYFLSVVSDFAVEPLWRPEWILPKILVADIFGRVVPAWHRLPQDTAPPSWRERIERFYAWIVEERIGPFAQYPSVLQGARRPNRPAVAELQAAIPQAVEAFRELANDPSVRSLLSISPFIEAVGFPDEALGDAEKVLASIRTAAPDADDKSAVLALSVLAHIAILTESHRLAESIAEVCLERARRTESSRAIFDIVCQLVECAAVFGDRGQAARTLVRWLEILAYIVPPSGAADGLVSTIDMLKRVQPELAPSLGRAKAAARLASSRAAT